MRIIDRKAFLAIEGSVLYTKVKADCDPEDGLYIKVGNSGTNDWLYDPLDAAGAIDCTGSEDLWDKLNAMDNNSNEIMSVNYESTYRDGLYEGNDVKFVVFDNADLKLLIGRLNRLLIQ